MFGDGMTFELLFSVKGCLEIGILFPFLIKVCRSVCYREVVLYGYMFNWSFQYWDFRIMSIEFLILGIT